METLAGFREIEHTADWEIRVWAPDFIGLLEQSARAMYWLSGVQLAPGTPLEHRVEIQASDYESLLVAFLSELLYYLEQEEVGFQEFEISLLNTTLKACLRGGAIRTITREIKAVTYHRLSIEHTQHGYATNLVFDV